MAVEKMKMMNLVALKQDTHNILREIVLNGSIHITNSSNSSNFTMRYMDTQIGEFSKMGVDISKISPYISEKVFKKKKYKDLLDEMFTFFDIKEDEIVLENLQSLNYSEKLKILDKISEESDRIKNLEESNRYARAKVKILLNALEYFCHDNIKISEFMNLKHIKFNMGQISKNSWIKLKSNYENIKGIVVHLGSNNHGETLMIFTPSMYEESTEYFLRSLSFDEIDLPNIDMSFKDLNAAKKKQLIDLEKEQEEIKKEKEEFRKKYLQDILALYYRYKIIEKIEELESHMAQSKNFVLLSAFVPESKIDEIKNLIEKTSESALVYFSEDVAVPSIFKIPTKLKNNFILRPFEALVKMYSIPDYKEADPTPFFAITYMLLFGMMFGDVGQGLVFVIAGNLLARKVGETAKIIQRIGLSSVFFGFMYGSVFGIEDILPAILLRPMEDINTILIGTITIGIIMIIVAYFIGFYNLKARNDIGNLYFDKNGISGFIFYMAFLLLILNITVLKSYVGESGSSMLVIISVAIMIVTSTLMFMKPKLAEKFEKSGHKEEFSPVESGFEMFETIMGFFSNTLSFIRVGAFAINHVGLFMAFHALGQMIGTGVGNVLMIVLGNIVILGLEGLIVFIQAIRLEYYELFSKYFKGDGIIYSPLHVDVRTQK
ncbi:hypothetical protein HMPREF9630_00728 [Peptoanaerobacter stomatis]|uniref:V-type ATPase 116kDa subunit domain protein n=1 Tax=Peptoanaerobacter stomatis TaxID=796937 RepID=J6HEP8_9FIRM|nr:V-type ATPase 116kDa subunit family protein [Peptoanaerobacter stomatis]EHL15359.1 hypothetical protein HMPREF9630_00728 [Peptoanaerobacter stomatis]EJU23510.1 V-type ATPase 116kDa subunit domain protein [Peptoanaerobacter stomatis]NWO24522.1 ATPase [Peptostreptococcaceae bacterium oral taxon 081]